MATVAMTARRPVNPDRIFFPSMCLLILITVWLGFSKTYYAVGMVRAKLPSTIIHVHAVVFSLWLLTLVVQTALVGVRKVQVHRRLGLWGFGLAVVMVGLGLVAATDALHRGMSPPGSGLSAQEFYVVPITDISVFAVLVSWAYSARRRPVEHKRLILFATITLIDAAIGRFPYAVMPMGVLAQTLIFFSFLAIMMAYDLATLRRVHWVTIVSSLLIVTMTLGRIPLAQTSLWMKFASMMHG